MTPERWQEIERLFQAALDREIAERSAFLDTACRDDAELRREVESLLAYREQTGDFIERPAGTDMRGLIAATLHQQVVPGRYVGSRFGVYELQSFIAAGGMGEVYRGVDTRLHRPVAVKLLPEHRLTDPDRRQRFKREAQVIASLNILTARHCSGAWLGGRCRRRRRSSMPSRSPTHWIRRIAGASFTGT
jgi:eukaryotic-like serine/threonine-protein kinase